ncbi:choice-of-anchor D domain-containing protein [Maribellus sp. CM-23]|uniref:choice-of-anchor D domain-containing protein n=1 Tax=Maribellus sp. CM-23 TaxID=2781026 RepID=UPI001F2DAE9B|nr:choice-of-anchor D domain-containing protein [Maribellus sp. CM-23]MCE4564244.1 choice-of-anchor D domain-containing protein [Maribellus sp. CM-23]
MKTFTFILSLILMVSAQSLFAQKVVVIGMNHETPDGFSFVATENIPVNEVIYFTDNEYSDAANAFTFNGQLTGEAVVVFTVTSALSTGDVVFVKEVSSNTFTVSGSGGTGTAIISSEPDQTFNITSNGDGLYAYADNDEIPTNGITQIYSVMYTGSGETPIQNGGAIPAGENPVSDYPNAVVVDGFPNDANDLAGPIRVEYKFDPVAERNAVSQTALENPNNYLSYAIAQDLSLVPFTNFNLSGANPVLTVSASPVSVLENSGSSITYTFTLSENASSNITANFSVGGIATLTTDYTQSGAASFNASAGTVTISTGTNTASITITPVGDAGLEPDETIVLTLTSGTGYDAGSPSSASGTIVNDDTQSVTPLVAITGTNQEDPEGFSFVALDNISGGTLIYFTENSFNTNTLAFTGTEAVLSWTAPAGGVLRGEVIVVKENPANTFTTSSNSGNSGSISLISGTMSFATTGEGFYAYTDGDSNPLNGVTEVHSVLYTGNSSTSGGNIPAAEDPSSVYTGALVVDGFAATAPGRTEYDPSKRNITVDNANFQNVSNWLHGLSNQDLSVVPFSNIIITTGSPNPTVTLAVSPSNVVEDAGDTLFYTFTMIAPASGDITINFDVAGTANFTSDYTVDGAATFTASSGSIVITDGTSSAVLAVVPVPDSDVEIQESVQLTITSGTGYDGGSPNDATGTISNDDTSASDPLVAITGLNHVDPDGFSFVAAQDIPSNTKVYFTDNSFDKNTLMFSSGEAVLSWTSPASIVPAGQVMVVTETSPDVFTITRSNGSPETGSIVLESGDLALATDGETFYAYKDNDNDPTNGVEDIYSVLYTGVVSSSGGTIPTSEDPSGIYIQALVVDGFAATAPNRTEYDPTKRNVLVDDANFQDLSNWLYAQTNQTLSTVPFDSLDIVIDYNTDPLITGLPTDVTVTEDVASNVDLSAALFTDDAGDSTVMLTLTVGKGTLTASSGGGVTVNGSGTLVLELTGTPVNIDTYLNTASNIKYTGELNDYGDNATTLSLVANDSGNTGLGGGSDVDLGTVNIDITAVNDAPVVTTSPSISTFTEGGSAVVIDSFITVTDVDNMTLASALIFISANFQNGNDFLSFANTSGMGNITGSYNSVNGALSLTSSGATATLTEWETALRAVKYGNNSDTPDASGANRTISFTVGDGSTAALVVTHTVNIQAVNDDPTATGFPASISAIEDIRTTSIDLSSVTLYDVDAGNSNLTLIISADNGTLTIAAFTGIVQYVGNFMDTIKLTGPISVLNDYIDLITNLTYKGNPNVSGTAADVLTIMLNDNGNTGTGGGTNVVLGTVNVDITPVNDPPVIDSVNGESSDIFRVIEAQNIDLFDNATVSDIDSYDMNGGFITITQSSGSTIANWGLDGTTTTSGGDSIISAGETISVNGTSIGTVHATNDGQGGNALEINFNSANSTSANIQILLRALTYSAPSGFGERIFTLTLNDADGTANGGDQDTTATFTINVVPSAPVLANIDGDNAQILVGGAPGNIDVGGDATVTDIDNSNFLGGNLSIVQNSGTANGSFSLTGSGTTGVSSGNMSTTADGAISGAEVIFVDGVAIAFVDAILNGQNGKNLSLFFFSSNATRERVQALLRALRYTVPSGIDDRTFTISLTDASVYAATGTADITISVLAPEIDLFQGTTAIANGESFSFGNHLVNATIDTTFEIRNSGQGGLLLSTPLSLTGADVSQFSIQSQPASDIASSGSTTFTVRFAPTTFGTKNVSLSIPNNDPNEDPYIIDIQGFATDTTPPEVTCQDIGIVLDVNGEARIYPGFVRKEASDNDGIASYSLDINKFDCADIGPNDVVLSVRDFAGNVSTCTATVSVYDNMAPEAICQDIEISLNAQGVAEIDPSMIDNGSTDECGIVSMMLSQSVFTSADLGENTVTLTVSDAGGNEASCEAKVLVKDEIAPVAACTPVSIWLSSDSYALSDEDVFMIAGSSSDNASSYENLQIEITPSTFDCSNIGDTIPVSVSVTDEAGNESTCNTMVYVHSALENQIDDIEITLGEGLCETGIDYPEVLSPASCATLTQLEGLGAAGLFPVGTTLESWEVMYNNQKDTVSFSVIVTSQNANPTLDPIADIDTTGQVPELTVSLSGISFGADCAGQDITVMSSGVNPAVVENISVMYTSPDSDGQLLLGIPALASGSDTITVTVTDSEGGSVSRTFVVTVDDTNQAPVVLTPVADQDVIADRTLSVSLKETFGDSDNDMLSLELSVEDGSALPDWISFANDTLVAMPAIADTGCVTLVVTATDPSMASASDTFVVCALDFPVSVIDIPTGGLSLNMYPNPSKGLVTLEFDSPVSGDIELMVSDMGGKRILQKTYLAGERIDFNLSDQVSGMYLVNVRAENQVFVRKLILNKK